MEPIINFRTAVLNLFWTLLPRHFLFIVCKISCKNFVSDITVKLDFDIDRKSANFNFKNPQNISLRFHFIMNLLWTFHGTHNILIMVINFIKLDGTRHCCGFLCTELATRGSSLSRQSGYLFLSVGWGSAWGSSRQLQAFYVIPGSRVIVHMFCRSVLLDFPTNSS